MDLSQTCVKTGIGILAVVSCYLAYDKIINAVDEVYFKGFNDGVNFTNELYELQRKGFVEEKEDSGYFI